MAEGYQIRELKIELTKECPLRCLHCSSNGLPQAPENIEPSIVADLIQEFVDMGGKVLAISGGEPLVYNDLSLILNAFRTFGNHPDFHRGYQMCDLQGKVWGCIMETLLAFSQGEQKPV